MRWYTPLYQFILIVILLWILVLACKSHSPIKVSLPSTEAFNELVSYFQPATESQLLSVKKEYLTDVDSIESRINHLVWNEYALRNDSLSLFYAKSDFELIFGVPSVVKHDRPRPGGLILEYTIRSTECPNINFKTIRNRCDYLRLFFHPNGRFQKGQLMVANQIER